MVLLKYHDLPTLNIKISPLRDFEVSIEQSSSSIPLDTLPLTSVLLTATTEGK